MGHDAGDRDAAERLTKAFSDLDQTIREAMKGTNNTHQTITLSAGGIGVWLCATFCAVMFAMSLVGIVAFVTIFQKVDRMQDYWNVTLQYVPGLKDHLTNDKGNAP